MSSDEKIKSVLSDLGRATLRGVRRCPKCGTFNGTRGLSCKNKKCNAVFKEKRKFNTEVCKLNTGNSTQIFSVRVQEKGSDYRGFVRLPLVQEKISTQEADNFIFSETALCFVDSCQRLFDASILKCHESDQCLVPSPMCQHIEAAIKCENEASTLCLRNTVLNSFNISNDIRQEIYILSTQTTGPLVQRVSKNVMAVKCQVSPKHPLGYLHFCFFTTKSENKYYCSCLDQKGNKSLLKNIKEDSSKNKKCVHFYACLGAFLSDVKLTEEFAYYINMEQPLKIPQISSLLTMNLDNQLVSILDNDLMDPADVCDIEIEVLNGNSLLEVPNTSISEVIEPNIHVQDLEIIPNGEVTFVREISEEPLHFSELTENLSNLTDSMNINSTVEIIPVKKLRIDNTSKTKMSKSQRKFANSSPMADKPASESVKQKKVPVHKQDTTTLEEKRTQFSFIQWLASVTERINQTMHYQFSGKPEALIFHVPQVKRGQTLASSEHRRSFKVFFECLRDRISHGGNKKRLPNFTSIFTRKDGVPLGTFTKYTWHITNILHLKQIFETPLVSLEITKSFIQNRDGTYEPYVPRGDENESFRQDGAVPIKPLELKTYLKVGNTTFDQKKPTPFVIEWIPDILPVSKIGELRLLFEFGHQKGPRLIKSVKLADWPTVLIK